VTKTNFDLSSIKPLGYEAALLEFLNESSEEKQSIWVRMGEQLEIQNYPKDQISKKITTIIEEQLKIIHKEKKMPEEDVKFKSGYFHRVMSKNSWTDKTFARNENNQSPQGDTINSSNPKLEEQSPFYQQRYEDIILIKHMRKFLSMIEKELEKNFDEVQDDSTSGIKLIERDWSEFYTNDRIAFHDFMKNHFANMFDEWSRQLSTKQSLLPKMWIISTAIMGAGVGISDFCSNYFAVVKNKTRISTKAWRKFMTEVNNYSDYMRFIQDDAWKWTVLPIECPNCKKKTLRTKLYPDGHWEFICTNKKSHKDEIQPHFSPNIFRNALERIADNTENISELIVQESKINIITNDPVKKK